MLLLKIEPTLLKLTRLLSELTVEGAHAGKLTGNAQQ